MRRLVTILVLVLAGAGSPLFAATRFGFVANTGTRTIQTFDVAAADGSLTASSFLQLAMAPVAVTGEPSGRFVYAVGTSSGPVGVIQSFLINLVSGSLQSTGTINVGLNPRAVVVDPTGRFVYVAHSGSTFISVLRINQTSGRLTVVDSEAVGRFQVALAFEPSGRFLYTALDDGRVGILTVDRTTGEITPSGSVQTNGGALLSLAVGYSGRFLFVGDDANNTVTAFSIRPDIGTLTFVDDVNVGGVNSIVVHQTERFLYLTDRAGGAIRMVTINLGTGTLLVGQSVATQLEPEAIGLEPTGRVAYVASARSDRLTRFPIALATGLLGAAVSVTTQDQPLAMTFVHSSERSVFASRFDISTGDEPLVAFRGSATTGALAAVNTVLGEDMVVDPTGRFVYSREPQGFGLPDILRVHAIDLDTGALTPGTGTALPDQGRIRSIAIDPTGRFLYVACDCTGVDDDVLFFRIAANGTALPTATFPAFPAAIAISVMRIDPGGRFLYVTSGNSIAVFTVNVATGGLTRAGTTVPTNGSVESLLIDPLGRFLYAAGDVAGRDTVARLVINSATGLLGTLGTFEGCGAPCGGGTLRSMAMSPTGLTLYVGRTTGLVSNAVVAFSVDRTSGALLFVEFRGLADDTASGLFGLVLEASGRFLYATIERSPDPGEIRGLVLDPVSGRIASEFTAVTIDAPRDIAAALRIR